MSVKVVKVKAKYDNYEYNDRGKRYTVFKAGCAYLASKRDDDLYVVGDAQGRQLLFHPNTFERRFEIIKEKANVPT